MLPQCGKNYWHNVRTIGIMWDDLLPQCEGAKMLMKTPADLMGQGRSVWEMWTTSGQFLFVLRIQLQRHLSGLSSCHVLSKRRSELPPQNRSSGTVQCTMFPSTYLYFKRVLLILKTWSTKFVFFLFKWDCNSLPDVWRILCVWWDVQRFPTPTAGTNVYFFVKSKQNILSVFWVEIWQRKQMFLTTKPLWNV